MTKQSTLALTVAVPQGAAALRPERPQSALGTRIKLSKMRKPRIYLP
jgi:hypothetical protein